MFTNSASISKRLFAIFFVLFFFTFRSSVLAVSYYVDSTAGNDTQLGTSITTPWKTLQKVSTVFLSGTLRPGDNILLKRGETWAVGSNNETLKIAGSSGNQAHPIIIAPYGSGSKPKILVNSGSNLSFVVGREDTLPRSDYIRVEELEIDANHHDGTIMRIYAAHHWTVEAISIHGLRSGPSTNHALGIAKGSKWIVVKNSSLYDNDGEAMKIGTSKVDGVLTENVVISNAHIYDNTGEAIDLRDEATNVFVYGGLLANNGTKQDPLALGGRYGYFYRCRVENSIHGISMQRYPSEGPPGYSGHHHTFNRCLFKNISTADKGAVQLGGSNHQVIHSTFVANNQPIFVKSDSSSSHLMNNIFFGYTGSAISGNVEKLSTISGNGFANGTPQGTNPRIGNPAFSSTDTYDLSASSPYYHVLPSGNSLGWSEPGWTETNYKQDFISSITGRYSSDIVDFVSHSISEAISRDIPISQSTPPSGGGVLLGDVNHDGVVNALDLGRVISDYYPDTPPNSQADINRDGRVNALDIRYVIINYRRQ